MAQWAVVVDLNSFGKSAPDIFVNGTVTFVDDVHAGQSSVALNPFTAPIADLDDPQALVDHIIARVVELGPTVVVPGTGGTQFFSEVDAAHVSFLPPYLPVVPPSPGVPSGVIAVLVDTAPIPTGWALCDGTSGTPDLTDVFRPKDNAVYIQKI